MISEYFPPNILSFIYPIEKCSKYKNSYLVNTYKQVLNITLSHISAEHQQRAKNRSKSHLSSLQNSANTLGQIYKAYRLPTW